MKSTVLTILTLILCVLLSSCKSSETEETVICGGVTDNSNLSAAKEIVSKEIVSYHASFFTYEECDEDCQCEFTFEIEKNSEGKMILNASCIYYTNELEISKDDLAGLQEIIDKYDLVKNNGTDRVTAGLPPECGPCKLRVTYASGEKLYFRYDGDMEEPWIRDTEAYMEELMTKGKS